MVSILAGFSLLASAFMVGPGVSPTGSVASTTIAKELTTAPLKAPKTTKETVSDYFKDDPIMIKIAWCESRFRQFGKDGKVIRGEVNSKDVGVMQINTGYHQTRAESLDMDVTTLQGNLAYAKYLYEKQGTAPWNASSSCWRDEVAMK